MLAAFVLAGEGPNTELAWMLWLAFGFFALIVIIGWLRRGEDSVPLPPHRPEVHQAPPPKKTPYRRKPLPSNPGRKSSK